MYCTKCGKELVNTGKFCIYCGEAVTPLADNEASDLQVTKEPKNSLEKFGTSNSTSEVEEVLATNAEKVDDIQVAAEAPAIKVNDTVVSNTSNEIKEIDQVHSDMTAKQVAPKNKTGIIFIAVGCLVGVLILGGVGLYFLAQNRITKQAEAVVALFDKQEYEEAQNIYNKYHNKSKAFNQNLKEELEFRITSIKEEYLADRIDYKEALEQLFAISSFGIEELYELTDNSIEWVMMIGSSRDSYQLAKTYFLQGDYESAITEYQSVIEEDPYYYSLAINEMAIAEQALEEEEQLRQEEARINEIREEALSGAAYYEQYNDYTSAIEVIDEALIEIPRDEVLSEKLAYYQELSNMSLQANDITSMYYEHSYYEEDQEILTISIELPVLNGNYYVYSKINQVFENFLQGVIVSNDTWAEDIREYVNEEYFYPNFLEYSYSVQYNKGGLLCIILEGYSYTGGAHGYPIRAVYTFDLSTGELLNLNDLMAIDENEFWPVVISQLQLIMDEDPGAYWGDAQSLIGDRGDDYTTIDYYLTEEGICIFFYPYDLSSYAMGFVEVVVPYVGNEWMFELQ